MSILLDENSKIIIQGITGRVGQIFSKRMRQYGTPLAGGITPGKGGTLDNFGVPVFNFVSEAVEAVQADWSLICVPPLLVKDAVIEAVDAGIKNMVIYSEGVPVHDSLFFINYAELNNAMIFGPNSAGVISVGKANVSDLDDSIVKNGKIGIVSKSGTLTYEVVEGVQNIGMGISTVVCLGGDPVVGTDYVSVLEKFEADDDTRLVILLGEPGGDLEIKAAEYIRHMKKKVIAYIVGQNAPKGKKMGHAGALVSGSGETAEAKIEILKSAGALTVPILTAVPKLINSLII